MSSAYEYAIRQHGRMYSCKNKLVLVDVWWRSLKAAWRPPITALIAARLEVASEVGTESLRCQCHWRLSGLLESDKQTYMIQPIHYISSMWPTFKGKVIKFINLHRKCTTANTQSQDEQNNQIFCNSFYFYFIISFMERINWWWIYVKWIVKILFLIIRTIMGLQNQLKSNAIQRMAAKACVWTREMRQSFYYRGIRKMWLIFSERAMILWS